MTRKKIQIELPLYSKGETSNNAGGGVFKSGAETFDDVMRRDNVVLTKVEWKTLRAKIERLEKENASLKIVEEFLNDHSNELCDEIIGLKKEIASLKIIEEVNDKNAHKLGGKIAWLETHRIADKDTIVRLEKIVESKCGEVSECLNKLNRKDKEIEDLRLGNNHLWEQAYGESQNLPPQNSINDKPADANIADMKAAIQRIEAKLATIEHGATVGATQQQNADIASVLTEMKTRCYGTAQNYRQDRMNLKNASER